MSTFPPQKPNRLSAEFVVLRDTVPVLYELAKHVSKNNDNQILLIGEVSAVRAELARNSRRMVIMTAVLVVVFLLLLVQSVRLEYTLDSVTSAHKSIQQTSFQLADVQKAQAEGARALKEAAADISGTRERIDTIATALPQFQVDGFGRVVVRVRLDERAAELLSKTAHGKAFGVTPQSKWATLPLVNGRIQYQ